MENILNCDYLMKKISITHVKGICVRGGKPQTYEAWIKGRWKKHSAELWLRRETMDPSIAITEAIVTADTYRIPGDVFFDNAEAVKD